MIEVGRVCVKTAGREAGKFCVILDVLKDGFVLVTGPKAATRVKKRKCSIHHIEPTPVTVKIKKNATDDEVMAAYKQGNVFKKLSIKEPTAKDIEKARDAERKRLAKAKAEKTPKQPKAEPKPKKESQTEPAEAESKPKNEVQTEPAEAESKPKQQKDEKKAIKKKPSVKAKPKKPKAKKSSPKKK